MQEALRRQHPHRLLGKDVPLALHQVVLGRWLVQKMVFKDGTFSCIVGDERERVALQEERMGCCLHVPRVARSFPNYCFHQHKTLEDVIYLRKGSS